MDANIAAAKGIDPCPMCGSHQVRWRRRRPTDFMLNSMRSFAEWFWAGVRGESRAHYRQQILAREGYVDISAADAPDVRDEIVEAETGHNTPRRFWRCRTCNREGHVF